MPPALIEGAETIVFYLLFMTFHQFAVKIVVKSIYNDEIILLERTFLDIRIWSLYKYLVATIICKDIF
jgi:hypothetical protein